MLLWAMHLEDKWLSALTHTYGNSSYLSGGWLQGNWWELYNRSIMTMPLHVLVCTLCSVGGLSSWFWHQTIPLLKVFTHICLTHVLSVMQRLLVPVARKTELWSEIPAWDMLSFYPGKKKQEIKLWHQKEMEQWISGQKLVKVQWLWLAQLSPLPVCAGHCNKKRS